MNKNLGFTSGVLEDINGKKVYKWLGDGGYYEDIPHWYMPYLRSFNHFHNPLINQGLNFLGTWNSSVQWALMPPGEQIPGGHYSWYDVRGYYLNALIAQDPNTRNTNFAETFRGIGQLMHLVQDASVPAHTRNDAHVLYNYEKWVNDNPMVVSAGGINPVFFTGPRNSIASFIDTNQYNGTNPPSDTSVGLSEYTNANFFSEDTIFSPDFPNPKKIKTNAALVEVTAEDGEKDMVYYVFPESGDQYRLAAYSYFYDDLGGFNITEGWKYNLDDNVYSDYAALLIPRAVGYSAGLVNYFFRGSIDMEKDPDDSTKYVIKNLSNESIEGAFTLYYDDTDDNRHLVASWNLSINAGDESNPVEFTEPTDAKEKGRYILVFSGTLGSEVGAVVGKVVMLDVDEIWEGWDEGVYTQTYNKYYADGTVYEKFDFETKKRVWRGKWKVKEGPEPSIRVEDGMLKVDASTSNYVYYYPAYGEMKWTYDGTGGESAVPLKGCNLKVNIPYANMSGGYTSCPPDGSCDYSQSELLLQFSTGTKSVFLEYGIVDASNFWNCGWTNPPLTQ